MTNQHLQTDCLIIGGGIAGLWTLAHLRSRGVNAILFETDALGSGQTIASQGIIHGGLKYALAGKLNSASEAIAQMPERWREALHGIGDVDLSAARVLSEQVYLWSNESLTSKLKSFFASKMLRSRVSKVTHDRPDIFKDETSTPTLYALDEMVLDIPSIMQALSEPHLDAIFKVDWEQCIIKQTPEGRHEIEWPHANKAVTLQPNKIVLTAGLGNEALMSRFQIQNIPMQRRALHQVIIKHRYAHPLFAHCMGNGLHASPSITITTHTLQDGRCAWYCGGDVATEGVALDPATLIEQTQRKVRDMLPWVTLNDCEWSTFRIDRAEPKQSTLTKPDDAYVTAADNDQILIAWPTKLALAPATASKIEAKLPQMQDNRQDDRSQLNVLKTLLRHPEIATPPWQ